MKKETVLLLIVSIVLLVVGIVQFQKWSREFPIRYMRSDKFHSLLEDVSGLYDKNSVVCTPDMINGKLTIQFTPIDQTSEKKLTETISEKYLDRRIDFVIKAANSNSETHLME